MTLYLVIFAILLYAFYSGQPFEKSAKGYCICMTVVLILVSGLRHEAVGNDTYAVMMNFERIKDVSWSEIWISFLPKYLSPSSAIGKDPGEDVLNKILSYFIPDSRLYLFVIAAFFLIVLGWFIYKHASSLKSLLFSYTFFMIIFYQYAPNSSMRQTVAIAILLIAYSFLEKKKFLHFFLLLLLASFFHKSSLVALVLAPLFLFDRVSLIYKCSLVLFAFVLLNYEFVANMLIDTNDIYGSYVGSGYYKGSKPINVILLIAGLYTIGLISLNYNTKLIEMKSYYYGAALSFILVPLVWVDPSALRLIAYFGIYLALLLGNTFEDYHYGSKYFIGLMFVFLVYAFLSVDNYHFMWEQMQLHERY